MKGAKVQIVAADDKITEGTVLGTQAIIEHSNNQEVTKYLLSLLSAGAKLITFNLTELKSITMLDEHLKKDVHHILNILFNAKKKDSKQLTIHATGAGERTVYLSYVVAAPLWKTSYRLLLNKKSTATTTTTTSDKPAAVAAEESWIQAYAIVDNTTDEDWSNINLSLVSGLPVSFVHNLYDPRYKKRPVVQVQDNSPSYNPTPTDSSDVVSRSAWNAPVSKPAGSLKKAAESATVVVRNVEVGDTFHYEIKHAVNVKRNGSALVPIFSGAVSCKRLVVFNRDVREKNPMSAVLLKNSTNIALEGGPATVYEEEHYVGEAMIDTLRPDEEKLLPFSVELSVVVNVDNESGNEKVHEVYISGGYMYKKFWSTLKTTYTINNKSKKKRVMVLEHKFAKNGYQLFETVDYKEKTDNYYRFEVELDANKTTTFVVKEKRQDSHQIYISNELSSDVVQLWIQSSYIDQVLEKQLRALVDIKKQESELASQISQIQNDLNAIYKTQTRINQNLGALTENDAKELRKRYIDILAKQEDEINALKQKSETLTKEKTTLNQKFATELNKITFNKKL